MKQNRPAESSENPSQSNERCRTLAGTGWSAMSKRPVAARASGTTLKKIQVQDWLSTNHPCRAGAKVADATTAAMANSACRIG